MSTDSADATASWLYEAVIRYLQGPMYTTPLMGFIDAKCLVFDDDEENKLEFTVLHNEFKDLVEGLLSDFLAELGVIPSGSLTSSSARAQRRSSGISSRRPS